MNDLLTEIIDFSLPEGTPSLIEPTSSTCVEDLEFLYQIFLGREWEIVAAEDRRADSRVGLALGEIVGDFISSSEFMHNFHDRFTAGLPAQGDLFESPPTPKQCHWAAARLPLSTEACSRAGGACSWYGLHHAIFTDAFFWDEILEEGASAALFGAAWPSPRAEAHVRVEDLEFLYHIFLGRGWEVSKGPDRQTDERVGSALGRVVRSFIGSIEFTHNVSEKIKAGRPVEGDVFDFSPTEGQRDWIVNTLPLSPQGCSRVEDAPSWSELHRAIFTDDVFRRDVLAIDGSARWLDTAPLPVASQLIARLEDIEFLYQVFLGRDWEFPIRDRKADSRIGLSIPVAARDFVSSIEFIDNIYANMVKGLATRDPGFDYAPSAGQRDWVAARLPLLPENAKRVRKAASWYALRRIIFADPSFVRDVAEGTLATQLGAAPRPTVSKSVTSSMDVCLCYEIFLGRPWELVTEQEKNNDYRIGSPLGQVVRSFVESSEFAAAVYDRMMAGDPMRGAIFDFAPTAQHRGWVAGRLLTLIEACPRIMESSSWYDFHSAIFADRYFCNDILGEDAPAARLGAATMPRDFQASVITASLLFERDWYLNVYRDVAASGGDPLEHFLLHGVAEGRNPNRLFDTRWYISAYPEVLSANVNPLTHYILKGAKLGYNPHPFFPARGCTKDCPAVGESDLLPLAEFLHRVITLDPSRFPKFGPYDVFRATEEIRRCNERPEFLRHIEVMTIVPSFVVVIDGGGNGADSATRESLARQIYRRIHIVDSIQSAAKFADVNAGESVYVLWLDAGDELAPDALYELASALNADPDLDLIYFDHEVTTDGQLYEPMHKPAWSPDYLESFDFIGSAACYELCKAKKFLWDAECRYDFVLRFTESRPAIAHIDRVLLGRRSGGLQTMSSEREGSDLRAIKGRLARTNRRGTVIANMAGTNSYDVKINLQREPLVSAIIPTAGRVIDYEGRSIDLIVACLESIVARSSYKNIEFIIIDNGDLDRDRLKHVEIKRIKFLTYSQLEVNIAKKINLGASHASGEILMILNDDIEPLVGDWIERMLGHLEKPHVGVVGAKLLYPDSSIQHAGVVSCGGLPDHVRRGTSRYDMGYAFSTCGVRNYSAVTGAVSMIRTIDFWKVGGYSENLPIDFNDIDLCYKIIQAGYYIVYEPKAELTHYESVSAVRYPRPQDTQFFWRKWAKISSDPYYNEYYFSKYPATFELAYTERRI